MFGNCTYFSPMCKQPTLIDYGLVPNENYKDIILFKVQDFSHLSDHCLIYACLLVDPCMLTWQCIF